MTDMAKKAFQEQEEVRKTFYGCGERLLVQLMSVYYVS